MQIECPECGEQIEVDSNVIFLLNRFYCSLCDALLEVVEEDPVVLDVVDEEYFDDEDADEDDTWTGE